MSGEQLNLYLNKKQFSNYSKGKPIQLTKTQIEKSDGEHQVSMELPIKEFKKLTKNLKAGKGYRFKPQPITEGAGMEEVEMKEEVKGTGVSKKRFKKGSSEAKAYMASLRSKRKTKGGNVETQVMKEEEGGSLKSIGKTIRKGIKKGVKALKPLAKAVSPYVKESLTDLAVAGLDTISESPAGNVARPLIKRGIDKGFHRIGLGVGDKKHPTHPVHYSHMVGGVPMSAKDIRNKKVGGSFRSFND